MPEARTLRASSRFVLAFAREVERERAKGEYVLLAVETVPQTPKLADIGLDEEVQSATVGELIRLVLGCRVDDGELGEGHAGTTSQVHISYPHLYPHFEEKS
jgi:hypothetical protein